MMASIFGSMPLSIRSVPAATISPISPRMLAAGGATLVQLRDKLSDTARHGRAGARDQGGAAPLRVPLLINDRVDVALASGADGVHVGQDDMAVEDARRLLGPDAIIGLSIKTRRAGARPRRSICSTMSASAASMRTTSKDNPRSADRRSTGCARIVEVLRAARRSFPLCAHRRHRRRQCGAR